MVISRLSLAGEPPHDSDGLAARRRPDSVPPSASASLALPSTPRPSTILDLSTLTDSRAFDCDRRGYRASASPGIAAGCPLDQPLDSCVGPSASFGIGAVQASPLGRARPCYCLRLRTSSHLAFIPGNTTQEKLDMVLSIPTCQPKARQVCKSPSSSPLPCSSDRWRSPRRRMIKVDAKCRRNISPQGSRSS